MPAAFLTDPSLDDSMGFDADDSGEVRLQPIGKRGWSRWMLPFCAVFTPIYLTALLVADATRLLPILAAIGVTVLLAVGMVDGFASANIRLRPGGISDSGILPPARFVATSEVASAAILKVYDTESLQATTQLFLLDAEGRTRFRMRGRYWTDEQIEQVAAHFDVPIERISDPLTKVELRATRHDQLVWFERRPALGTLCLVAAGGLVAVVVVGSTLIAMGNEALP